MSFVQKSSFKELVNGDMKRLRNKKQYKDIVLEGKNYIDFIVNKAKIQNSITKLTKDNIRKFITSSKQDFKVDIDSVREAIDSSVELHKLILHQLLLNQQIKLKEKEKKTKKKPSNSKCRTMYLYDKEGNNCIKFIAEEDKKNNEEQSVKKDRLCGCKKKIVRSKSMQCKEIKGINTNNKTTNKGSNIIKYDKNTPLEELQEIKRNINQLIDEKAKELENIIEEDKKTTDKEETVEIEEETNMQKLQRIKEKLMKEKEESDSYLNELDTKLRYKSSKSNLKSSQSTFASTQNFPRSSSVKNINSYRDKGNYLSKNKYQFVEYALKSLRQIKTNTSSSNLYKPNDIFYLGTSSSTKNVLSNSMTNLPISHYKMNPAPRTERYKENDSLWITDAYVEKMHQAGLILNPETVQKIMNYSIKPSNPNYHMHLLVKDLIEMNNKSGK